MSDAFEPWPRPRFEPGGPEAFLFYVVFGAFPAALPPFSRSAYRSLGPGAGWDLRAFSRRSDAAWMEGWTTGAFGSFLEQGGPALRAAIDAAPAGMMLQAELADPERLDYLRDANGFLSFLLDQGGAAILDPQTLRFFSAQDWRSDVFERGPRDLASEVVLLVSENPSSDEDEGAWLHTRGLRKFGRPDLSLTGVRTPAREAADALFQDLIRRQIQGERFQEGQVLAWPRGELVCRHRGHADDPDFNNVHIALEPA